ncbi:MAG: hypothetical protein NTW52_03185 [Planctomycetota bacterium]|nr:hypothetical protein [Planctomycetota bacterium]
MIVGQFCQAQVTTQVARASSGAVNHFPIIQAIDLASATEQLRDLSFQLIAIAPQSQSDVCYKPLAAPLAFGRVFGIEDVYDRIRNRANE